MKLIIKNTVRNFLFVKFIILFCVFGLNGQAQNKDNSCCGLSSKDSSVMKKDSLKSVHSSHNLMNEQKETNNTNTISKAWNLVCPIMGDEVDPDVQTVEYNGKVYGFCCAKCIDKFKKEPAKYSANLSDDGTRFIDQNK